MPEELIRCYEHEEVVNGKREVKAYSLMLRRDVPQYRTRFLQKCIELFNNWRLFEKAPPCGQGWANERSVICEILTILECENTKYDEWIRDKESQRSNLKK